MGSSGGLLANHGALYLPGGLLVIGQQTAQVVGVGGGDGFAIVEEGCLVVGEIVGGNIAGFVALKVEGEYAEG